MERRNINLNKRISKGDLCYIYDNIAWNLDNTETMEEFVHRRRDYLDFNRAVKYLLTETNNPKVAKYVYKAINAYCKITESIKYSKDLEPCFFGYNIDYSNLPKKHMSNIRRIYKQILSESASESERYRNVNLD